MWRAVLQERQWCRGRNREQCYKNGNGIKGGTYVTLKGDAEATQMTTVKSNIDNNEKDDGWRRLIRLETDQITR